MKSRILMILVIFTIFITSTSALSFSSTPADIEIMSNETATLTWSIDTTGIDYTITMDDGSSSTVVSSGVTGNSSIKLDVQNLAVGTYNFTIVAGSISDSVIVTVTSKDTTSPEVPTPLDILPVIAVLAAGILLKRKRA